MTLTGPTERNVIDLESGESTDTNLKFQAASGLQGIKTSAGWKIIQPSQMHVMLSELIARTSNFKTSNRDVDEQPLKPYILSKWVPALPNRTLRQRHKFGQRMPFPFPNR